MEDANAVEVRPESWMMPNRKGFLDWAYNTFKPDMYNASPSSLFPHQRFVRDFLQFDSPYRGLLLFHELGTGKTASSIAAAEGFVNRGTKVVVMVPASLAANYKNEIMRYASIGNPHQKMWALVDLKVAGVPAMLDLDMKVKFIKQAKQIVYPMSMLPKDLPKTALVKHDFTWASLSDPEQLEAMSVLNYFIDKKYVFINYNGLSSRSSAMNVLQEAIATPNVFIVIDEAHNFISRVVNGGKIARTVYNMIMEAQTAKLVLLTGTPVINHPFEVAIMLSLVRGPIISNIYTVLQTGKMPNDESEVALALANAGLDSFVDDILLDKKERKIIVTYNSSKEKEVHALLHKLYKLWKRVGEERSYALPTDKEVFCNTFLNESDPNNPRVKNIDIFRRRTIGLVSYLKTVGEEYFPRVHPMRIAQVPMSQFQFNKYSKERTKEREIELNNKKKSRVRDNNILGNKGSVYRAFSRMTCNFVFPDEISRPFPGSLRQLMKREIDTVDDENEEDEQKPKKKDESEDIHKKYERAINKAMESLQENSEVFLTSNALSEKYSPKMARILEDINQSPGKTLMYSQFRTVEGLGIMRLVLEQAGYKEVEVENGAGGAGLHIVNEDEVMSLQYDNKRFITFNADRDKTNMLLRLFNDDSNIRGKGIRLLLITQSGAEGISLKCVRQVLIMEPFWNTIRLSQVIGRAVRARSHELLPEIERDVKVILYTAAFTKQMLKDNFTIRHQDDGKTTDTHVYDVAKKKDKIVALFLNELKASAVDCRINANVNKPVASGMQCFAFPIGSNPLDFAYFPRIGEDMKKYREKPNRNLKVSGKAVMVKGKKYVVVDEYPTKLFDYNAYKDAGVLVE